MKHLGKSIACASKLDRSPLPKVAGFDSIRPESRTRVYYAHHIWKYDTEIEEFELSVIQLSIVNCNVINPKDAINQNKSETEIMRDCLITISDCDVLVFSDVSGMVGKGVLTEIRFAQAIGIPVYRIVANRLEEVTHDIQYRLLDTGSNRVYAEIVEETI